MSIFSSYPRDVQKTLVISIILVGIPIVLTAANFQGNAAFWENTHWTIATWCMTYLGYLGWRSSSGEVRRIRGIMTLGLCSYAIGQLLWDVQWATTYTQFPAPSDIFYLGIAPFLGMGLFLTFRDRASRADKLALGIDSTIIFTGLATIIFTLYGTRSLALSLPAVLVLIAYPVVFLALGGTALLGALSVRSQFRAVESPYTLLLGLGLSGVCWVVWNNLALTQVIRPGNPMGYGFSISHLVVGLGVAVWNSVPSTAPQFNLWTRRTLWILPILILPLTVAVKELHTSLSAPLRVPIMIGGLLAIILVVFRQSILLIDRDTLLLRERASLQRAEYEIAERKQAETALRESELKFRSIFDNSIDAIGVSKTGVHVTANQAYLKMFGYDSVEQLAGKPILDLIAPSHHAQIMDYVHRRAAGETVPSDYETRGLRRDGTEFEMEVHVSAYELGGELYTVPILRDITEQKRAEERIGYQANLLKNVSDAIIATDLDFRIVSWNRAAEMLYGWRAEKVIGQRVSEVLQTKYLAESADQVRQRFLAQNSWEGEVIQKHKNGTQLFIMSSVSAIIDENGRSAGAVAVNRDITDKKQAEKNLRESERRFREMLKGVHLAGVMLDSTGQITFINDFLLRTTGWTEEDVLGKNWFDMFLPSEIREEVRSAFGRLIADRQNAVPHYENEILTAHGERRLFHWSNTILFDANGNINGTASIGEDITERKQVQNALQVALAKYKALFESFPLGITVSDAAGNILETNPVAAKMLAVPQEEYTERSIDGREWRIIRVDGTPMPPDEFASVRALKEKRVVNNVQMGLLKPDDSIVWLNVTAAPLPVDGYGVVITYSDITAQMKAEAALRESEALYRQAIEVAGAVPYLQTYMSGITEIRYDFIGEGIRRLTGYGPEEFNLSLWDSLVEESVLLGDLAQYSWTEAIRRVRTGGDPIWKCEHRIRARDGSTHWVFEAAIELRDQNGVSHGSIGMYQDITERKRAEEKLRASEERYRLLAQNLPDSALFLYDRDLRLIIADGPELKVAGFSREQLEGRRLHEALPGGLTQLLEPNMRRALTGEAFHMELPYENSFYRFSHVPLFDSSGHVATAMILITNITQLKQAEDALRDSQKRLSTALRATRVGAWEWDMRTNQAYWSDENYRLMGYEPGKVESKYEHWARAVHPDDLPAAEAKVAEAINTKTDLDIEFRVVWPDGSIHWINDIGSILLDDTAQPLGMYGIQMDITERKRIQEELEENRRRQAFLLLSSPAVIYSAEASGNFGATFVSGNVVRLMGYMPQMFTEDPGFWIGHVHPDDLPNIEAAVAGLLENNFHRHEYRFRHAQGHYVWMRDEMRLIRDERGEPLEIIGSWVDVTEQRHAAAEREALIQELESKNIESETLRESAAAVALSLDLDETALRILEQLQRVVPYDSASVSIAFGNEYEIVKAHGFPEGKNPIGMRFVLDEGDPAYPIVRDGLPYVLYSNVQDFNDRFKEPAHNHIFSWMAIPLYVRGRLTGMLAVDGFSINQFTEAHAQFAMTFANQVAVTLENSRLYTKLQSELEKQIALRAAITAIASTLHLSEVLGAICRQMGLIIDAASVYLTNYDPTYTASTVVAEYLSSHLDAPQPSSDLGSTYYKQYGAWMFDKANHVPFTVIHADNPGLTLWAREHLLLHSGQSILYIPLYIQNRLIGHAELWENRQKREFTDEEIAFCQAVSQQAAIAIENAHLFEELQKELAFRKNLIRELEAKNEELERFTYTVSHDLKSPLVTIKGFLGFLKQDIASGNIVRFENDLERIGSAATKMEQLLWDLLELSRIGRLVTPSEVVSFETLVQDALEMVHGQQEARGVAVQTQPNLPAVYGDRQRLTEVLQNLLDNAIKFMGTVENPQIKIGLRGEKNGKPVFFVQDNGIGIAPEFQERIFGLFNKLDPKIEGTGIGLALVRRIIEFHGGQIWVESVEGQGSTFLFTLPPAK